MTTNKKPFIGESSAETRWVVALMKGIKPGQSVSYDDITKAIGRDAQKRRGILDSARRVLMRDHNIVFRCVPNEGFVRLDDSKIVDVVTTDRRSRMRSQSRMAIKELGCANYEALDDGKRVEHNTGMAMFGALYQATSTASVKRLHQRVVNAGGSIDISGTLRLIGWLSD